MLECEVQIPNRGISTYEAVRYGTLAPWAAPSSRARKRRECTKCTYVVVLSTLLLLIVNDDGEKKWRSCATSTMDRDDVMKELAMASCD